MIPRMDGQRLRPEELRYWVRERLFDQVPIAIAVIDRDFHIVEANRSFVDTYGESRGRYCFEVYKGNETRCERCGAMKTFNDGRTRRSEERGVDRNGEPTYYVVDVVPLIMPNGDIPYVIEMSTDITDIRRLERQKLEAERLAAVGQTVAGLAHGIKNIIMGLEGGMYVVNSGLKRNDPERLLSGWKMLEEEIGRISAFAREFLDFAKGRPPAVTMSSINEICQKVIDLYRDRAAQSGIALVGELQEDIAPAPLDSEGLHICLDNLVSNAIDACEMSERRGTKVMVRTREDDEGKLVVEVSDDGCGMDYDVKRKVFTNYFSTKASGRGTGLGLLTTRKIVTEHGGRVSVDSEVGEGSVFRLELERSRLPEPDEAEPGNTAPA